MRNLQIFDSGEGGPRETRMGGLSFLKYQQRVLVQRCRAPTLIAVYKRQRYPEPYKSRAF